MTASAAVAANEEVRMLFLDDLYHSPFNPRKTFDQAKVDELADSIAKHGLLVPILVRPLMSSEGWEIVAGSRRRAACAKLGTATAPCIVRDMTDDEAREIAIVDNLQREDMPALEEADAYEALRQQLGTAEAIAVRVGKPVEYVAKRLRLVVLGVLQREALAERLITVDHALLLARLGVEEQDKNLKWALDVNAGIKTTVAAVVKESIKRRDEAADSRWGAWEPQSVAKLKNHIEQHAGRALSKAPWDLQDAGLVKAAGACANCPSNTAHNTSLFSDLSIEAATCEDGACFESKREAFVLLRLHDAYTDKAAIKLSYKSSEAAPRMAKDGSGPNELQVLRAGQWVDAKKGSCDFVRNGVTVDWEESRFSSTGKGKPGVTKLVCIALGCKAHPKAFEKKAQRASGPRNENSEEDRIQREKNAVLALEENKRRIAFVGVALEGITKLNAQAVRKAVVERMPGSYSDRFKAYNALLPGLVKIAETSPIDSPEFAKAAALAFIDDEWLQVDADGYDEPDENRRELIKAVRALGYAGPDPWAKPSKVAKPAAKKAAAKPAAKKAPSKKAAKKKAVKG